MGRHRAEPLPEGQVRSGHVLQAGTLAHRVYKVVAECPGVRVTTAEVATELDLISQEAGSYLRRLWMRGLILTEGATGRGTKASWYVPELADASVQAAS